jgi:lysophospholipase L1-like esterase
VEFEFNATIATPSNITFTANSTSSCYFKAYVDGQVWKNGDSDYYVVSGKTSIVLRNVPAGTHNIRVMKVTGYTIAQAELLDVTLAGTINKTAPADKDLYIEFLGDSISCGWGTIGGHTGAYTDQDGTLAYPYRVAEALGADYSIMALSGRGVVYGTDLNFDKNYLHASPSRSTAQYGFERQADIVVINLGTNDRGQHADANEFEAGYLRLLENVFAKNGSDCIVYCLWGAMNDTYNTQIQNAIATYKASHASAEIYTLELAASSVAGGEPSWGHPSIEDHTKYTTALENALKNVIS